MEVPFVWGEYLAFSVVRMRQTQIKCFVLFSSYVFTIQLISEESGRIHYQETASPKPAAGRANTDESCLTIQEDKRNFKPDMICRNRKTNKQNRTEEKCQSKPDNIAAIDSAA